MPLFNFMYQFHPYIVAGTKPGTIRGIRKRPCKPGDTCYLYPPRFSKPYKRIIEPRLCTDVKTIILLPNKAVFEINAIMDEPDTMRLLADDAFLLKLQFEDNALSAIEKNILAWKDGFRSVADPDDVTSCFEIMYGWWKHQHHLHEKPFAGHHILWDIKGLAADLPY